MTTTLAPPTLDDLEAHRVELRGYCYRVLGSVFDADDAVQDTLVKAWQSVDSFEGRSSLRSWLYRIATNTCLDALRSRGRRAQPMDLSGPGTHTSEIGTPLPHEAWVEPAPTSALVPAQVDPALQAVLSDSVRLAFVAALQHLPPRQRAVLVLREVLQWSAAETADLLDSTVASVNSALQRARATLEGLDVDAAPAPLEPDQRELLARYVEAFEAYDTERLVRVLAQDASISMPPLPLWLEGRDEVFGWYFGKGIACAGSRLLPVEVNGVTGFAQYKPDPEGGFAPWSIQVLELADTQEGPRVAHVHHFLDPALFARFGLPDHLDP